MKESDVNILKFYDGVDLLKNWKKEIDLIFLDIDMQYMDGMSAAKKIREKNLDVAIIFITKLAHMAIKGYEVEALDFIVKPVEYYAFRLRFEKALTRFKHLRSSDKKICVSVIGGDKCFVKLKDIYYIEIQGRKLSYHTKSGVIEENGRLYQLEETLTSAWFIYINRYTIVNIKYVSRVEESSVVVNGETLSLSRGKKKNVMAALLNETSVLRGNRMDAVKKQQ